MKIFSPVRIIVGVLSERVEKIAALFTRAATQKDVERLSTNTTEAVKLFSNTYLAMDVAYFMS